MESVAVLLRKLRQVKHNEEMSDDDEFETRKIVVATKIVPIEATTIPEALKSTTLSAIEKSQKHFYDMKNSINEVSQKMKSTLITSLVNF